MRLIDRMMDITGKTEEELQDDCPFNHEELRDSKEWSAHCDDCETCLGQEVRECCRECTDAPPSSACKTCQK